MCGLWRVLSRWVLTPELETLVSGTFRRKEGEHRESFGAFCYFARRFIRLLFLFSFGEVHYNKTILYLRHYYLKVGN